MNYHFTSFGFVFFLVFNQRFRVAKLPSRRVICVKRTFYCTQILCYNFFFIAITQLNY